MTTPEAIRDLVRELRLVPWEKRAAVDPLKERAAAALEQLLEAVEGEEEYSQPVAVLVNKVRLRQIEDDADDALISQLVDMLVAADKAACRWQKRFHKKAAALAAALEAVEEAERVIGPFAQYANRYEGRTARHDTYPILPRGAATGADRNRSWREIEVGHLRAAAEWRAKHGRSGQ